MQKGKVILRYGILSVLVLLFAALPLGCGNVSGAQPLDREALAHDLLRAVAGRDDGFSITVRKDADISAAAEYAIRRNSETNYAFKATFDGMCWTTASGLFSDDVTFALSYKASVPSIKILASADAYRSLFEQAFKSRTQPESFLIPSGDTSLKQLDETVNAFKNANPSIGYAASMVAYEVAEAYEDYALIVPIIRYRDDGRPAFESLTWIDGNWSFTEFILTHPDLSGEKGYFISDRPVNLEKSIFNAYFNDGGNHAYYFGLNVKIVYRFNGSTVYNVYKDGEIEEVAPDYARQIDEALDNIKAEIDKKGKLGDTQKYRAIAAAIAKRVVYDYGILKDRGRMFSAYTTLPNKYNASSEIHNALVNGTTICSGYAQAFSALCNMYGLPCWAVTGYADKDDTDSYHAWNAVLVDGELRYVDVTWADDGFRLSETWMFFTYEQCVACGRTLDDGIFPPWYSEALDKEKTALKKG
ncbi:MAG: hypothetical protein LLF87_08585 [Eubacteriales bacterium]|nr:hypothetical protein [Eubacteriales bacterium]